MMTSRPGRTRRAKVPPSRSQMPVSPVRVITGTVSIHIELCRRRAGLAVSFLIELISRFRSHQCSVRPTLSSCDSSSASSRNGITCLFSSREGLRSPALPTRFILVVVQIDLRQCLAATFASGFRSVGWQIAKTPIRAATSASSSQLPPGAWSKAIDCWIQS